MITSKPLEKMSDMNVEKKATVMSKIAPVISNSILKMRTSMLETCVGNFQIRLTNSELFELLVLQRLSVFSNRL